MFLYYTLILFLAFFLGVLLARLLSVQKRIKHALTYGRLTFDIDLPEEMSNKALSEMKRIENVNRCSQEEFFFMFVTGQMGRLPTDKREALKSAADQLTSEIKMKKSIYKFFSDEYDLYEGLNDADAKDKWLKREEGE